MMHHVGRSLAVLLFIVALAILWIGHAAAVDRYVAPAGSDAGNNCTDSEVPCATVGQAVLSAESRDVIKVARGTYVENVTIRPELSHLSFEGGWEPDFRARRSNTALTVIDGGETGSVLGLETTVANSTLRVDSFTIQNGSAGIAVSNLGATVELNLNNCRIRENASLGGGGVVFINNGTARIEIAGCDVSGNVGIFGGVSLLNFGIATLNLTESRVSGNISSTSGGGPIRREVDIVELRVAATGFIGGAGVNVVTMNGGDTNADLYRNRIVGNGGLNGGGVLIISQGSETRAQLTNNLIAENNTVFNGGGVAIWPVIRGTVGDMTGVDLLNNTITGNTASTASSRGGGVFVSSFNTANNVLVGLNNCIVWGNTAPTDGDDLEMVGEAVHVVAGTSIIGPTVNDGAHYTPAISVVDVDPLFVDSGMGDYHLQPGSPAIDAGTYGVWMLVGGEWEYFKLAPVDDFEGDLRPEPPPADCCGRHLGCDIGADQYVVLPVPADTFTWNYPAQPLPLRAPGPKACRPLGVGPVAGGGDDFNWRVHLPPFTGVVDTYLLLYAPALIADPLLIRPDGAFQRPSEGVVAYRTGDAGGIEVSIFGNVPAELLPPGTYYLMLLVTAPGTFEEYYLWVTSIDL